MIKRRSVRIKIDHKSRSVVLAYIDRMQGQRHNAAGFSFDIEAESLRANEDQVTVMQAIRKAEKFVADNATKIELTEASDDIVRAKKNNS